MSSSISPQSNDSDPQNSPTHLPKSTEASTPSGDSSDPPKEGPPAEVEVESEDANSEVEAGAGEEGEEEEGECGFCLYMKGGGCKDPFIAWEKCVEESEAKKEDIVEKCSEVTAALKKCMEAHPDYYGPLLQAEKAAEEDAARQLEEEKANEKLEKEKQEQVGEKEKQEQVGEKEKQEQVGEKEKQEQVGEKEKQEQVGESS